MYSQSQRLIQRLIHHGKIFYQRSGTVKTTGAVFISISIRIGIVISIVYNSYIFVYNLLKVRKTVP